MRTKLLFGLVLFIMVVSFIPTAQAIDRWTTLYPYDPDMSMAITDDPTTTTVTILLCVNAENGFAVTGRTYLSYNNFNYAEVGWVFAPDNEDESFVVPSFLLRRTQWVCQIDENAQPGGHIIYKFYY